MKHMYLAGAICLALAGCGESSSSNDETNVKVEGQVGHTASFGGKGAFDINDLHTKTYYARFAFCLNNSCNKSANGIMHFDYKVLNGVVSLTRVYVDSVGITEVGTDKLPRFGRRGAGRVYLAKSFLAEMDSENRMFKLAVQPASSASSILPAFDVNVLFSQSGKYMVSAGDEHLFVAQRREEAPSNWLTLADQATIAGPWRTTSINISDGKIKQRGTIDIANQPLVEGVSSFKMGNGFLGLYKESGFGYTYGYSNDIPTTNLATFRGISGAMLLAPDRSFGVGYDTDAKSAFIMTR